MEELYNSLEYGHLEESRWILENKGSECADTAEMGDGNMQGNVAIG